MSDRTGRFPFIDAPILVLGDVMLDGYVIGDVRRISPEAPVPVLRHSQDRESAGGAANVALNIVSLGGKATLVGLVGDDAEGRRLAGIAAAAGVVCDLVEDPSRPTIAKTRVMAGAHQMIRIDREVLSPLSPEVEDRLIARAVAGLEGARALAISDYAKGVLSDRVLTEVIAAAKAHGVPVLIDPKRTDFAAYAGADVIKPNRGELSAATGLPCGTDAEAEAAARRAIAVTGADILLTRSEQGIAYYPEDGEALTAPTQAAEVFDVSGAGDTVLAAYALAVAGGMPAAQAMRLANAAAGVVVSKAGTAVVALDELEAAMEPLDHRPEAAGRLLSWDEAARLRDGWRRQGLTVGLTNGCFDLLHPGHVAILREAAAACDRLIVALNTDESVSRLKGPTRPVQAETARAEVVGAIRGVDAVVLFGEPTPLELIQTLVPDVLVKGADYTEDQIVGADVVKAAGGRIVRVPLREGHSTTRLVERSKA
ncbi:MAG: D-glycero-beta-D-manno-heptose-7-phosphate kinase [Brevundimonas sp.]